MLIFTLLSSPNAWSEWCWTPKSLTWAGGPLAGRFGEVGGKEHPGSLSHGCNAPSRGRRPQWVPGQGVGVSGCPPTGARLLGPTSPPHGETRQGVGFGFSRLRAPPRWAPLVPTGVPQRLYARKSSNFDKILEAGFPSAGVNPPFSLRHFSSL